jgi:hypothetical protein
MVRASEWVRCWIPRTRPLTDRLSSPEPYGTDWYNGLPPARSTVETEPTEPPQSGPPRPALRFRPIGALRRQRCFVSD